MRVYLHTFGCKANQYDTEVVRQALESAGATPVADAREADVAVINSCTVTHVGEAKMRGLVRRLARARPGIDTVIMGCAAALDDGTLASLPGVRAVLGGADPDDVRSALGLEGGPVDPVLRRFARGTRAWLKIQDGCDEHCTFCATTLARGASRSRPGSEIVAEAQALAAAHEEIVLTGVHIGSYGMDLEPRTSLGQLVAHLIDAVPRVRFRLTSVEATEMDDQLEELMIGAPDRLAPHLHAPLQSGSDRILKRMGRHWYTASTYRARCEALAAKLPVLGLGADVMVGFPGETDADHRATCDLVQALPFTYLHVFPYSERPGTAAPRLGRSVPPPVQAERTARLRALADERACAYRAARPATADIVVLGRRHGRVQGLSGDYLDVYLPAVPGVRRFTADVDWTTGEAFPPSMTVAAS